MSLKASILSQMLFNNLWLRTWPAITMSQRYVASSTVCLWWLQYAMNNAIVVFAQMCRLRRFI